MVNHPDFRLFNAETLVAWLLLFLMRELGPVPLHLRSLGVDLPLPLELNNARTEQSTPFMPWLHPVHFGPKDACCCHHAAHLTALRPVESGVILWLV